MSTPTLLLALLGVAVLATVVMMAVDSIPRVGDELPKDGLHAAELDTVPASNRYQRFEHRDYSGDRGPAPAPRRPRPGDLPRVVMPNVFEQLCQEIGWVP